MLFHAGCIWRLNQLGLLGKLNRISSVSGGSIIAGVLGMNWKDLDIQPNVESRRFEDLLIGPIRRLRARQSMKARFSAASSCQVPFRIMSPANTIRCCFTARQCRTCPTNRVL